MQDIEIAITEQGMKDALAALAKADKSAIYVKQLKAKIFDGEQRGPGINALPDPRLTRSEHDTQQLASHSI
jgi:hypothetical protein